MREAPSSACRSWPKSSFAPGPTLLSSMATPRRKPCAPPWRARRSRSSSLLSMIRCGSALRTPSRARSITLVEYPADSPDELPGALKALASGGVQAALTVGSPLFYSARERIITVLNNAGVPGMHPEREFVEAGGFLSYGIDFPALWRQAAGYVDKILGGTSPADLPIQQPARFELLVNLRAARLIQRDIAPSLLARADQVIE